MNSNLKISESGVKFIGGWEGLFRVGGSSRYAPKGTNLSSEDKNKIYEYIDPVGLPTIGYGHLLTGEEKRTGIVRINGQSVNYKTGLTHSQVISLKAQDLVRFENSVRRSIKVPITQSMYDACVSISYNIGTGGFEGSTLLKKLNAKNYRGAADEFLKWNKAGGRVITGLTNRRRAERSLFLSQITLVSK